MNAADLTTERIPLIEICPRCGNCMTVTTREHAIIRTCITDGYEAIDVDGESKLAFAEAIGTHYLTRSWR